MAVAVVAVVMVAIVVAAAATTVLAVVLAARRPRFVFAFDSCAVRAARQLRFFFGPDVSTNTTLKQYSFADTTHIHIHRKYKRVAGD